MVGMVLVRMARKRNGIWSGSPIGAWRKERLATPSSLKVFSVTA